MNKLNFFMLTLFLNVPFVHAHEFWKTTSEFEARVKAKNGYGVIRVLADEFNDCELNYEIELITHLNKKKDLNINGVGVLVNPYYEANFNSIKYWIKSKHGKKWIYNQLVNERFVYIINDNKKYEFTTEGYDRTKVAIIESCLTNREKLIHSI